ncbi:MAG: DNA replication initiation protein [Afipia sp.]|nr:DNA replication initiation protein [Afipia sp.]
MTHVASGFGVKPVDILCGTRGSQKTAFARQVAMYLAHVGFGLGFATVGECFRRDRTTVAHACRVVEDRRDDIWFDCRMAALELACSAVEGEAR